MKNYIIGVIIFLFIAGCATKFEKVCQGYGFSTDSADYAVCVDREAKILRQYLERQEAEEKAKHDSFYRELKRKRLGLDIQ